LSTLKGVLFFTRFRTIAEIMNDINIPSNGATTINIAIFITPAKIIDPKPLLATAAPTRPPTRVCDELEGNPHHHVNRFQIIAAQTAEKINVRVTIPGSMTPLPIVVATFKGKIRNATKLNIAARATAAIGESTFVDTTVAIELAES
jgi:hypothetical protein